PNDNRAHGDAKRKWKSDKTIDFRKDVDSTLALMYYIDHIKKDNIITWFNKNLFLKEKTITLDGALNLLKKSKSPNLPFFKECLRKYYISIGSVARGEVPFAPFKLISFLDGVYWESIQD